MEVIQDNNPHGLANAMSTSAGAAPPPTKRNNNVQSTPAARRDLMTKIIPSPLQTTTMRTSTIIPGGRIHNVASACVNCRKAHLACDVGRPCRRCVSLNKADSCEDVKHKKRGRPKLNPRNSQSTYGGEKYEVMRGTIFMPTFPSTNKDKQPNAKSPTLSSSPATKPITFCHQQADTFLHNNVKLDAFPPVSTVAQNPAACRLSSPKYSLPITPVHLTSIATPSPGRTLSMGTHHDSRRLILILTMDILCARVSDNVTKALGYFPQELTHRSLYEFIAADDHTRLSHLHRQLLLDVMSAMPNHAATGSSLAPPVSIRSSSDLFYNKRTDELALIANGANTFRDSLHLKSQPTGAQRYDVCAYLGGALGADLTVHTTFPQLYIVMICHATSPSPLSSPSTSSTLPPVTASHGLADLSTDPAFQDRPPTPTNVPIIRPTVQPHPRLHPLSPAATRPRKLPNLQPRTFKTIAPLPTGDTAAPSVTISHTLGKLPSSMFAPKDFRHVSLPAHFTNNSTLNTASFQMTSYEPPKINVAPSSNTPRLFPSTGAYPEHPIKDPSARPLPPSNAASPRPSRWSSRSSSSSNHFIPSSSRYPYPSGLQVPPSYGPRPAPIVSHPATQYFLQTSSSTLNAAASMTQRSSKPSANMVAPSSSSSNNTTPPTDITRSPRRPGMSIHSLLC
ncbi:hypothetical protein DM01DRAFT_1383872 [Hesseltinella vesiculosa]|uniref:Zn(2)-C6 fungal-type domain-containing protein n=1 Tax=Hesseltinella vesiculosa TaxID=101127 RepID=A0A1X2GFK5_9FUNG|nr:hypothetical protein DM01DRAFT_1383872 [Hesseltinella vesiculosa]